jgi:hypothetical protein
MRHVAPLFAAIFLAACASSSLYRQEILTTPTAKLERGKPVLVATPKNGTYDKKEYRASGQRTAATVRSAFARFSEKVAVSSRCTDLACLQLEGVGNYSYFVIPEILHWEDRNTEWSGKPDRVDIKLVVVDARSNVEVASMVFSRKSQLATKGDSYPQDLLPEPIKLYVDSLY